MNNTLNRISIESGIFFDEEGEATVDKENLEEFARHVVTQFFVEVIRFQMDTGCENVEECIANAEANLFTEDFDQAH